MSRPFLLILVAALLAAATALPTSSAATRDWTFTDFPNEGPLAGTFAIGETTGSNGQVSLPALERVVWADPTFVAAAADVSGGEVALDLAFAKALRNTEDAATILVEYGYVDATGFHAIDSWDITLTQQTRNLAVGDVDPSMLADEAPGTLLEIGHYQGTLVIDAADAVIPKDSHPAIGLTSNEDNTLYTEPSFMGSSTQSTATVPLPELPAIALLAIGAALVGGVALVHRGRRS